MKKCIKYSCLLWLDMRNSSVTLPRYKGLIANNKGLWASLKPEVGEVTIKEERDPVFSPDG